MTLVSARKRFSGISALSVATLAFSSVFIAPAQAFEEPPAPVEVQAEVESHLEVTAPAETQPSVDPQSDTATAQAENLPTAPSTPAPEEESKAEVSESPSPESISNIQIEEEVAKIADEATDADNSPAETDRFIVEFAEVAEESPVEREKAYVETSSDLNIIVDEVRETATGSHVVSTEEALTESESEELIANLESQPNVVNVEPDTIMYPTATPNDPVYGKQWDLHDSKVGLRLPKAWDKTTGKGQIVAVIDSGITAHSDLSPNILPGYDMISDASKARDGNGRDSNPRDEGDWVGTNQCGSGHAASTSSWHGTNVAGIVASVGNNGKGTSGTAPGVKVLPVRALGVCGGYSSDIADAIMWAAGIGILDAPKNPNPARTINLSLGGQHSCNSTTQRAINMARWAGATIFVAAGNSNTNAAYFSPASCDGVITVAASNRAGARASYSNYGTTVDVTAPGGDFKTSVYDGVPMPGNSGKTTASSENYVYGQGTSMAAPHAAAIGALMLAANPKLTADQIESKLKATARSMPGGCSGGCGAGLIDATAAVVVPPQPACPTGNVASTPLQSPTNASLKSAKDVIAVDGYGRLWNYSGNGNSGLNRRVQIGSGWQNHLEIFVADWNNDGILDIVSTWKDGKLKIYLGKSAGGFSAITLGNAGWEKMHSTVGKLCNGSAYPQIVSKDTAGNLWVYRNHKGSYLSPRVYIGRGWQTYSKLTMVDWDQDGNQDIVTKNSAHQLMLYRTNGSGTINNETRKMLGSGWNVIRNISPVEGFAGEGSTGFIATDTNGLLRYYNLLPNQFGSVKYIGKGWQTYRIAR